jgi:hypothetical protein
LEHIFSFIEKGADCAVNQAFRKHWITRSERFDDSFMLIQAPNPLLPFGSGPLHTHHYKGKQRQNDPLDGLYCKRLGNAPVR